MKAFVCLYHVVRTGQLRNIRIICGGRSASPVAGENGGCVADQEDEQRPGGDAPCRKAERSGPVAEP